MIFSLPSNWWGQQSSGFKSMKLVYLAQSEVPSQTANSVHVMKMCDAFAAQGVETSLWLPGWRSEVDTAQAYEFYGVQRRFQLRWLPVIPWLKSSYAYAWQVWVHLVFGKQQADLVFSRSLLGAAAALLAGRELVLEVHEPMRHSGRLQGLMFDWIVRHKRFRKLVVITHALKDWHLQHNLLPEALILVAPDGADVPLELEPQVLGSGQIRLQLGYVGSLHQGKGVELLLPLAKALPEVDVHVVGGSGEQLQAWKCRAEGISNMHFHGFMKPAQAHGFMLGMDALLAPNQRVVKGVGGSDIGRWTSPLKIFEYMAARRPILASDLPVLREVLDDGRNCLLADAENVDAWCANVHRLQAEAGLAARLSDNAYADLQGRFSWACRAKGLLSAVMPSEERVS